MGSLLHTGQAELPGPRELSFGPVQIDFEMGSQELAITNARVEKADSHLQARGEMTSISPLAMDLDLDYRLDQGVTNELAAELKLSGTLEGQAHLTTGEDGLDGEASFRSSQISSPLFGSWSVDGALSLQGLLVDTVELLVLEGASIWSSNTTRSRPTFRRSTSAH